MCRRARRVRLARQEQSRARGQKSRNAKQYTNRCRCPLTNKESKRDPLSKAFAKQRQSSSSDSAKTVLEKRIFRDGDERGTRTWLVRKLAITITSQNGWQQHMHSSAKIAKQSPLRPKHLRTSSFVPPARKTLSIMLRKRRRKVPSLVASSKTAFDWAGDINIMAKFNEFEKISAWKPWDKI
jgi:hypothetical protein